MNVRDWGHVHLFSPWRYNTDPVARVRLRRHGWQEPPGDAFPTGEDLYEANLKPLAETPELAAAIETNTSVRAISRDGIDKVVSLDGQHCRSRLLRPVRRSATQSRAFHLRTVFWWIP
jgi:hypothetical protein